MYDSGVGGISVLRHIHSTLPGEALLYCADSANAPYGNKPAEFIIERSNIIADFLVNQNAKALVVACNTATAASIAVLRERLKLPIIGMEPAVKPAVAATKSGVIGILATVGTLKSARFAALLESFGTDVQIVTRGCPGLVEQIENGHIHSKDTIRLLEEYLEPLLTAGADTIVLGCTHYPFLRPVIRTLVGEDIKLVDTGAAVARQVQRRLSECDLLNADEVPGAVTFFSNTINDHARRVVETLWGEPVPGLQPLNV